MSGGIVVMLFWNIDDCGWNVVHEMNDDKEGRVTIIVPRQNTSMANNGDSLFQQPNADAIIGLSARDQQLRFQLKRPISIASFCLY